MVNNMNIDDVPYVCECGCELTFKDDEQYEAASKIARKNFGRHENFVILHPSCKNISSFKLAINSDVTGYAIIAVDLDKV
jgi:hypothetical protein